MRSHRILILAFSLLSACGGISAEGDYYFVRSGEADLPVWVRGNVESGTFLVFLHGGPGYSAMGNPGAPAFNELEKRYAVVYWDQRASGSSQGNVDPSTLTMEQFVEDTDRVLETLALRYSPRAVFLVGHSWGGALGTAYLLDPARQAKVRGWVEIDGSHDVVEGYRLSRERMLEYIDARLAEGVEEPWRKARDFYEATDRLSTDNILTHTSYVGMAGGYSYRNEVANERSPDELIFASPSNTLAWGHNEVATPMQFDFYGLSFTRDMERLTLPSLVMWGRHDGILPVGLAQQAYEALGTPGDLKRLVIFEESAHSPQDDEPTRFATELSSFIDQHR